MNWSTDKQRRGIKARINISHRDEGGEAGRWRISDGRCTSAGLHGRLRGAPPAGSLQPRARAAGDPRALRWVGSYEGDSWAAKGGCAGGARTRPAAPRAGTRTRDGALNRYQTGDGQTEPRQGAMCKSARQLWGRGGCQNAKFPQLFP